MPENTQIYFLNIHAEGKDKEVLISNNQEKYKPNHLHHFKGKFLAYY